MTFLAYAFRRLVAISLGLALTGYSAWASWTHQGDLIGPLAAVSAAALLALTEYAWRDGQRFLSVALLVFGLASAAISGSVVLERVAHSHAASAHKAASGNLPRSLAAKATVDAETRVRTAEAAVLAETGRGGCKAVCKGLKEEAKAAREELTKARSLQASLGAETSIDPAADILGSWAATIRLIRLLGLPLWLELAAPVVLAYGFAPGAPKAPVEKPKAKRRAKKRAPRKPTVKPLVRRRPNLRLVAVNDNR